MSEWGTKLDEIIERFERTTMIMEIFSLMRASGTI